jgi:hypothetical protein
VADGGWHLIGMFDQLEIELRIQNLFKRLLSIITLINHRLKSSLKAATKKLLKA